MNRNPLLPMTLAWVLTVSLTPRAECQNTSASASAEPTTGEQTQRLPFLLNEVPKEYREYLPLPLGLSLNYVHQIMPVELADPSVEIPGVPLPPGLVRGGTAKPVTNSYVARFDAWLLPFLNVYGTAGRFKGTANELKMDLAAPVPLPIPQQVSYQGSTYGAGITAAFGYRHFFASYDVNWNWAKPDITNTIRTQLQGLRGGVQIAAQGIQARIYLGAMRMDIDSRVRGTVVLESGLPATFDVKVEPKTAWSPIAGIELQLSRHFSIAAEMAFGTTKQFLIAPGFRF